MCKVLMQDGDWTVACDCDEANNVRQQVFRTRADALTPGWHTWETNWMASSTCDANTVDWRDTGLSCETTRLR
jgi:hypothetical protein